MKILSVKIDGLYSFNNFEAKFNIPKRVKNVYRENKIEVSIVNPKDINILVGANASGKTTFGKVIWMIEYLIRGNDISELNAPKYIREDSDSSFEFEYVITDNSKDYFYKYSVKLNQEGIINELLEEAVLSERNSYSKIKYVEIYSGSNSGFKSNYFANPENESNIANSFGYTFKFSDVNKQSRTPKVNKDDLPIVKELLMKIDNSIVDVYYPNDKQGEEDISTFTILFNDGKTEYIKYNDDKINDRISYGTTEALHFVLGLMPIINGNYSTIYLDEILNHVHFELEKDLIALLINYLPPNSQLFYTTHSLSMLKINLPISCYSIFYKDENGFNSIKHVEDYLSIKNDRNNLSTYLENDYFGVSKDIGKVYNIIDNLINDNE